MPLVPIRGVLDPGVTRFVNLLRDLGFNTTDSGDGYSKGVEGLPYPHVVVTCSPERLIETTDLLTRAVQEIGLELSLAPRTQEEAGEIGVGFDPALCGRIYGSVEGSYKTGEISLVMVRGVLDKDLPESLCTGTWS